MTDAELIKLDTQELSEENARILGMEILNSDIDYDKAVIKRKALVSAVLTAGVFATGMNDPVSYGLMGADSVFLLQLFEKMHALYKKKKALKQFSGETYPDSYVDFIKECQEYVRKKYPDYEQEMKRWLYGNR